MLERLHMSGALAVIGCTGGLRIWDLAERVFARVPEIPADESRRIRSERLLGACGIMRDSIAVSPGGAPMWFVKRRVDVRFRRVCRRGAWRRGHRSVGGLAR